MLTDTITPEQTIARMADANVTRLLELSAMRAANRDLQLALCERDELIAALLAEKEGAK